MAQDPIFDEAWREWILTVRRQSAFVDFADMIYGPERLLSKAAAAAGGGNRGRRKADAVRREGREKSPGPTGRRTRFISSRLCNAISAYPAVPRPKKIDETQNVLRYCSIVLNDWRRASGCWRKSRRRGELIWRSFMRERSREAHPLEHPRHLPRRPRGGIVVGIVEIPGYFIHPPPPGFDMNDMEALKAHRGQSAVLGTILGPRSRLGAWAARRSAVACLIVRRSYWIHGASFGGIFILADVSNYWIPTPLWLMVAASLPPITATLEPPSPSGLFPAENRQPAVVRHAGEKYGLLGPNANNFGPCIGTAAFEQRKRRQRRGKGNCFRPPSSVLFFVFFVSSCSILSFRE